MHKPGPTATTISFSFRVAGYNMLPGQLTAFRVLFILPEKAPIASRVTRSTIARWARWIWIAGIVKRAERCQVFAKGRTVAFLTGPPKEEQTSLPDVRRSWGGSGIVVVIGVLRLPLRNITFQRSPKDTYNIIKFRVFCK